MMIGNSTRWEQGARARIFNAAWSGRGKASLGCRQRDSAMLAGSAHRRREDEKSAGSREAMHNMLSPEVECFGQCQGLYKSVALI